MLENQKSLEALSREFDKADVKQRTGKGGMKLDYISIDSTINRLNSVLGSNWSFTIDSLRLDANAAYICGTLSALGKEASGVGASSLSDPDDAVKTALAEAIKKAGHQFGIGLYLWDEGKRKEIEEFRNQDKKQSSNTEKKGLPF